MIRLRWCMTDEPTNHGAMRLLNTKKKAPCTVTILFQILSYDFFLQKIDIYLTHVQRR